MRSRTFLRVWVPVAVFVLVCVAAAGAYVLEAPRHYRAAAEVLVTPVSGGDDRYAGLPVLRPPTAVGEAARLASTSSLAEAVRARLALPENAADVLADVRVRAAPASSVLDIVARSRRPVRAVRLANSFADLLVAQRTATLRTAIVDSTARTFDQLVALPPRSKGGAKGAALRARLARLRSLAGSSDPSMRVLSRALRPVEVKPKPAPILAGAVAGSLLLGGLAGLLAIRRRRPGREYDPEVSEEVVAQLEQRLAERIETLLAEQERLAAREAELAERERALATGDTVRDERAHERAHGLDARLKALTTRELELVKRAGALAAREKDVRSRDEQLGTREHRVASREQELQVYAEELDRLARDVDKRGAELDERAAELEERAGELEQRAGELETRSAAPPAPSRPAWEPAVPPPPPLAANVSELPQRPGQWNLNELSRLVEERGAAYPERHDEWQSYLFFLRSYAEPDGSIPGSFDWLIEEQFGVLTSGHPAPA